MMIFNSDGSRAEMCMNGCCCAAHFLHFFRDFGNSFILKIGERRVKCSIINENNQMKVLSTYEPADYKEAAKIKTSQGEFFGHIVSVGNPHFVILKRCEASWLSAHGKEIESHEKFPRKTNVEFAWMDSREGNSGKVYNLLVYERGCGITLACGSGVAATLWTLFCQGAVKINESIEFIMPGGNIVCYIDPDKNIVVQAEAENVFQGDLNNCKLSKESAKEKKLCIGN